VCLLWKFRHILEKIPRNFSKLFPRIFCFTGFLLYPFTQITRSGQRTSEEKLLGIIKIPGVLSKLIARTIRLQWEFFGIYPKLVPRTIHSKHTNIPNEKFRLISGMENLLGTNAECTRNFSHGIIPAFYWIFS
jgi:hypothetical protein